MMPRSIYVATPTNTGSVTLSYLQSILELSIALYQRDIPFSCGTSASASILPAARNCFVDDFRRRTTMSHLLFIDADMGFAVGPMLQMLDFADRDVVAAMCTSKKLNWSVIAQTAREHPELDPARLAEIAGTFEGMVKLPEGSDFPVGAKPVEVAMIGTGIMLISRTLLDQLAEHVPHGMIAGQEMPVFFDNGVVEGNRYVGEDYIFCERVRAIGGRVWGCPWLRTIHSGHFDFIGNLPEIVKVGPASKGQVRGPE